MSTNTAEQSVEWEPTNQLRFKWDSAEQAHVLEQMWQGFMWYATYKSMQGGLVNESVKEKMILGGKTEWRKVPTVEE